MKRTHVGLLAKLLATTTLAVMLAIPSIGYAGGAQVAAGNTLDFTPTSNVGGATASWAMDTASWNYDSQRLTQFASECYSYNELARNVWQRIEMVAKNAGPGNVYHFKSATAEPMDLVINLAYYNGNWGGHTFIVLFSDENDFANLSPMAGGDYWNRETNTNWTSIYDHQVWGGDGGHTVNESVSTIDGEFYVRFDMATTDGYGGAFQKLSSMSVDGTVATGVAITPSNGTLNVSEFGDTDTYEVVLTTEPTDIVVVTVDADSQIQVATIGQSAASSIQLTFTTADWDTPQTVTVSAVDDAISETGYPITPHSGIISHMSFSSDTNYLDAGSGGSLTVADVNVLITDNDVTCGIEGMHYHTGDFNTDCYVDLNDFADLFDNWARCNTPGDPQCEETW